MKVNDIGKLAVSIILCQLAGFLGSLSGLAETRSPKSQNRLNFLLRPAHFQYPLVSGFFRTQIIPSGPDGYRSSLDRRPIYDPEFL